MGLKRWTVTHAHDPDTTCLGCPFVRARGGLVWCAHSGVNHGVKVRMSQPAPDWCPLRALPDAEAVEHG